MAIIVTNIKAVTTVNKIVSFLDLLWSIVNTVLGIYLNIDWYTWQQFWGLRQLILLSTQTLIFFDNINRDKIGQII